MVRIELLIPEFKENPIGKLCKQIMENKSKHWSFEKVLYKWINSQCILVDDIASTLLKLKKNLLKTENIANKKVEKMLYW